MDAYVRAQMPKGPVFHIPPEVNSDEDSDRDAAGFA